MVKILERDESQGFTKTLAFMVMPDHVHWLVTLESGEIANAVKRVKSIFSQQTQQTIWNVGFMIMPFVRMKTSPASPAI